MKHAIFFLILFVPALSQGQLQMYLRGNVVDTAGCSYGTTLCAVIDRANTEGFTLPADSTLADLNTFAENSAVQAVLDSSEFFFVFWSGEADFSRIDWANPTGNMGVNNNSPNYVLESGVNFSPSSSQFNTGFFPNTDRTLTDTFNLGFVTYYQPGLTSYNKLSVGYNSAVSSEDQHLRILSAASDGRYGARFGNRTANTINPDFGGTTFNHRGIHAGWIINDDDEIGCYAGGGTGTRAVGSITNPSASEEYTVGRMANSSWDGGDIVLFVCATGYAVRANRIALETALDTLTGN